MSTRGLLLNRLSIILNEVIDIDKVDAIPLKLDSRITFPNVSIVEQNKKTSAAL